MVPHLLSCNLLKAFILVNDAGTELIGEAYTERGVRQPLGFMLLHG